MEIKIARQVNGAQVTFTVDAKSDKESIEQALFYAEKDYCWLDGFQDCPVVWKVRKAKSEDGKEEYVYLERKCFAKDGRIATSTAGEYQKGGFYWKKWEVYDKAVQASM